MIHEKIIIELNKLSPLVQATVLNIALGSIPDEHMNVIERLIEEGINRAR